MIDNMITTIRELRKQNKIIQRMAEYISKLDTDEDICKNLDICLAEYNYNTDKQKCIECIVKYFSEVE